jgi:pilus assembly protein CpaE
VVDLVEVADEISVRHLQETLFTHREGVRMLLAPDEGERAEEVDSYVARNVLGAVRARHALTVVDLGATVSEASAIGAEMASTVLVVSTPDVVALRGVRRLRDLWRRLQVREDDQDVLVLLNQASRKREVQPDLARKVVGGRLAETTIPADFAAFEAAVNTGSPARMEDQKLRGTFEALAAELEALPVIDEPADADGESRGLLARLSGERGQTTVEFAGILPLLLVVVLLLWQIGLVGYTFVLAGHSAREGARELATDTTDTRTDRPYADKAVEDLPDSWKKGAKVDRPEDNTVRVRLQVPVLFPSLHSNIKVASEAGTVIEDEPLPASQRGAL